MPIMRKMNLISVHFWTYLSNCAVICIKIDEPTFVLNLLKLKLLQEQQLIIYKYLKI